MLMSQLKYHDNFNECFQKIVDDIQKFNSNRPLPKPLKQDIKQNLKKLSIRKAVNRYIVPQHATATYVRHIIRIAYTRVNLKQGTVHRIKPPMVKTIEPHVKFLIITPHHFFNNYLKFYYMFLDHTWVLFTNIHIDKRIYQNPKLKAVLLNRLNTYKVAYQVGQNGNCYYTPVMQFSLQSAYYRLIDFTELFCSCCITLQQLI